MILLGFPLASLAPMSSDTTRADSGATHQPCTLLRGVLWHWQPLRAPRSFMEGKKVIIGTGGAPPQHLPQVLLDMEAPGEGELRGGVTSPAIHWPGGVRSAMLCDPCDHLFTSPGFAFHICQMGLLDPATRGGREGEWVVAVHWPVLLRAESILVPLNPPQGLILQMRLKLWK